MQPSPTSQHVLDFAEAMEYKLSVNRHKGDRPGWLTAPLSYMIGRLQEELDELEDAVLTQESSEAVLHEAADVANIAMMIADIYRNNNTKGTDALHPL